MWVFSKQKHLQKQSLRVTCWRGGGGGCRGSKPARNDGNYQDGEKKKTHQWICWSNFRPEIHLEWLSKVNMIIINSWMPFCLILLTKVYECKKEREALHVISKSTSETFVLLVGIRPSFWGNFWPSGRWSASLCLHSLPPGFYWSVACYPILIDNTICIPLKSRCKFVCLVNCVVCQIHIGRWY